MFLLLTIINYYYYYISLKSKLFNTVKFIFTNKDKNVLGDLKTHGIENRTLGQNLKVIGNW